MKEKDLEKIIIRNIDSLIGEKFGDYSKYIIQERALPDLRDGLKPVQRRILYAMNKLNLSYNSSYKKSARVVGDVIGKYHPHGDTSVYEAMVRMSQDWKMGITLVDMHGNNGSIDGDGPAAMRYTESRLGFISQFLMENIEKKIIPFVNNFDNSEIEPTVFPAQFPNILVNGAIGIASGYATNIPPHNLNEVIDALIYMLKTANNPHFMTLANIVKGPDFPTGGKILGTEGIINAYQTGKGKVKLASKYHFDHKHNEIIIDQIPFEANKADIVKQINNIINANKVSGLLEVRDDSGRNGLKITIIIKDIRNAEVILSYLFKNTDLRKTIHMNMIAITDKKPTLLNLRDILENFIEFQFITFKNLYTYELNRNLKKMEIVKALMEVVVNIDEVVKIIRSAKNKADAKEKLAKRFNFNDNQTEAIVNLRLYRLTSTDVLKLQEDYKELQLKIDFYNKALTDSQFLTLNIIKNLKKINSLIKTERKTEIIQETEETMEIDEKALIEEEKIWLGISADGYIKKISVKKENEELNLESYKLREADQLIALKYISNFEKIYIFTSKGRYYSQTIHRFNSNKLREIGDHFSKYFSILGEEKIVAIYFGENLNSKQKLVIASKDSAIKQMDLNLLSTQVSKKGNKYINLKKNDEVVTIELLWKNKNYYLSAYSANGYYIRYDLNEVPSLGLQAGGVKNLKLNLGDEIIGIITSDQVDTDQDNVQAFALTKLGKGKRFRLSNIKQTSRASKGKTLFKDNDEANDQLFLILRLDYHLQLKLITEEDQKIELIPHKSTIISDLKTGFNILRIKAIKKVFYNKELVLEEGIELKSEQENKKLKNDTNNQSAKQLTVDEEFDIDQIIEELK